MHFEVTTHASPEQVLRALTDFSERRLETWSRTLDRKRYEVREHADTWAVARESTPGSPFWVVARYDWSDPTVVRWTVVESSYGGGGSGAVRISPATAGSRLDVAWDYTDIQRRRDKVMMSLIPRFPFRTMIARMWTSALDKYAAGSRG